MTEQQQDVGFIERFLFLTHQDFYKGKTIISQRLLSPAILGHRNPFLQSVLVSFTIHSFHLLLIFPFIQPCELSAVSQRVEAGSIKCQIRDGAFL